ncbi:MAG TPA: ElyC/SanA/YdcF family protein [Solirubrobacterales bacterium]|nr:ElyC/SanA/YdcF family protein [Solirubrobacterales bacterium]
MKQRLLSALRALTWPWRRYPKTAGGLTGLVALLCLLVVGSNAYILLSTDGEATSDVADVPPAEVAIVPGALVNASGQMSGMLADRVKEAALLWHTGKVSKILVSGDHGQWTYDEPDTMRKALVRDGVAPADIFEDHAGFDTWATMVRARSIFDVKDAVVVTQGFHMPRALYLAEEVGIHATGLLADLHQWGYQGEKSEIREVFSRVKAIWDTTVDTPAMAGPRIPIQTSDGRESWGPAPPPGTPPAGSPDSSTAAAHIDAIAARARRST